MSDAAASTLPTPALLSLDALDLAALLCSKVCHDVISPVGAIVNGLEMLEEEKDAEMRAFAQDLVKRSAASASARLQFCRLAYGAAGSAGAEIDTGDAEKVARGLIEDDKTKIVWTGPRILLAKNKVKLLLNLCQIAASAIPRGGVVEATIAGAGADVTLSARSSGAYFRLSANVPAMLAGRPETGTVDAHGIQSFYAGLVARQSGMDIEVIKEEGAVTLKASPKATEVKPAEAAPPA